jgi:hypothetical protein
MRIGQLFSIAMNHDLSMQLRQERLRLLSVSNDVELIVGGQMWAISSDNHSLQFIIEIN